jgi:hypothetical protein
MLDMEKPDLVVAFPGGRGTADMVRRAKAAGVRVVAVTPEGSSTEILSDLDPGCELRDGSSRARGE